MIEADVGKLLKDLIGRPLLAVQGLLWGVGSGS